MLLIITITLFIILISILIFRSKKKYKILFTGPTESGKTILINKLRNHEFKTVKTIENYTIEDKKYILTEKREFDKNLDVNFDLIIFMFKEFDNVKNENLENFNFIFCSLDEKKFERKNFYFLNGDLNLIKNVVEMNLSKKWFF